MINFLKNIDSSSPLVKKVLLPVYLLVGNIIYWIYKILNLSFSYQLLDKTKINIFPKGQIAKDIFWGGFEKKELEIFQSLLTPESVMIDAGANIGLYSIIGSKLVGIEGKVYSFEPSKANFDLLSKNIELNHIKNIIPINKGLGDKIGETLILSQNFETGDAEKYILKSQNKGTNTDILFNKIQLTETISLETLDNFQLTNNLKKVDFLKIDVEGYEYYVLKGAEQLLKKNPEIIILFECAEHLASRAGSTQTVVFSFLNKLGFEIVYWNEKEKKWSNNQAEAMKSGQLLGGRNIMNVLNNL